MSEETATRKRGSEYLYETLVDVGVKLLVGIPGTQTLPLDRTVAERNDIEYVMARHETAVPHVAWGYHEASHQVAATITVPGPGDTNAAHGLKNALDDNVPILHISPIPNHDEFGRHPIHELEHETFDHVVKANITVESPIQFQEQIKWGIKTALAPPTGPVRIGIPRGMLAQPIDSPAANVSVERINYVADDALARVVDCLADAKRPLLYVGGGARRSPDGPDGVAELASVLDAPVAASYKGKGVFSEDDDRFLGVTGGDLPAGARTVFETADVVLALGTNFDGPNTANWSIPMGETLVHVNLDPAEIGAAYDADIAVVADVGEACKQLAENLDSRDVAAGWDGSELATAVRTEYGECLRAAGLLDEGPPVASPGLLRAVREVIPRETVVTTDIGGHRIWSKNVFEAYAREELITAGSWAGMGVGLPSAIGAKLARPDRPVLTLTGDGSLMMCAQELHTAAEYGLDLVVILFNDADYGVISKAMHPEDEGNRHQFKWTSPDWTAVAEGYGCRARKVRTLSDLREATEWALETDGPTLVDVNVDPNEPTAVDFTSYETEVDPRSF
ncbi:thiamine pyrophosphate-binding protein [Halopelagius fulvigenes]|uniref:Thiamine pyrophosphate-binding protein n=1 Tax=Halopelagius fulvigenes TaxID=1198324 RepID=A0ABD5U3E7_9EURY